MTTSVAMGTPEVLPTNKNAVVVAMVNDSSCDKDNKFHGSVGCPFSPMRNRRKVG